jgi:DNA-binding NarL/FixJ family response regulator
MLKPIRVVIIDDHAMVREGLKKILIPEANINVVGEACDGKEGITVVGKMTPDVAVLDLSMPGVGGLEVIASLRKVSAKTKIVILSMHGKEALAQEALREGASAYILKGDSGDELIAAIHSVHKGNYYFSAQLRAAMVSSYIGQDKPNPSGEEAKFQALSERERQFFRLMLAGNSTAEISQLLGISHKTGQKHRTSIVKKLGTGNPMEMFRLAMKLGLVDLQLFEKS